MNFTKYLKYTVGSLWVLVLIVMISITIVEKIAGTEYVQNEFYSSSLFLSLWILFTILSCLYIFKRKLYRRRAAMMLHFSLIVILLGALCTWFLSERGRMHLEIGQSTNVFADADSCIHKLPFTITLKDFYIEYYRGTATPMDFVSHIAIKQNEEDKIDTGVVSMNNIYSFDNYRFYQTGYYDNTTILSVSHDPYGIAITYTGYILLLISIIMFLASSKSRYRTLVKRVSSRTAAILFSVFFLINGTYASSSERIKPEVLPEEIASDFGDLYIYYNERVCPVQTFAREFTRKIYGRETYRGFTPEQVLTGWMFYYDSWKTEPMIQIKSSTVADIMGIKEDYVSVMDYFTDQNTYCLDEILSKIHKGEEVPNKRSIIEADEKFVIISQVATGAAIKIYPQSMSDGHGINWYSQVGTLPSTLDHKEWVFVRKSLDYLNEKILMQKWDDAGHIIKKIKEYQEKKAGNLLPSKTTIKAEKLYNKIEYTRVLSILVMILGVVSLIVMCRLLIRNTTLSKKTAALTDSAIVLFLLYLTVLMSLRAKVSGHMPLSNGYETMQFMAWCTLMLTAVFRNKYIFIRPFGLIISGFALIVSMLGISNPQITPLMPVLSSPLLSIHVMVIMIAYALLSFIMLNAIMALVIYKFRGRDMKILESFKESSEILLYPAVFLLAIGIFIGAVWANVSWGRYWGWDPKETWALITMLIYAMAIHSESFGWFKRPLFFHVFTIAAFISVLITYFGVNFILGGMHSYA